MSLLANIEHLVAVPGIVAAAVQAPGRPTLHGGSEGYAGILEAALQLIGRTDQSTVRLMLGRNTIVVQSEGEERVAVVLPMGHVVAKSLRRLIRRLAHRDRGPLAAGPPSANEAPTVSPAATGT